jgi:hypothetical protein
VIRFLTWFFGLFEFKPRHSTWDYNSASGWQEDDEPSSDAKPKEMKP